MKHPFLEEMGALIKKAREEKGLSQQALSKQVSIPQSHLSKIENGLVDLQISSLIELTRTLEMDLMFVPRQLIPTFKGYIRGLNDPSDQPRYILERDDDA